jgi:hypothetical protein
MPGNYGILIKKKTENWFVEGCDDLDEVDMQHKNAFYVLFKGFTSKKNHTSILLMKKRFAEIKEFCLCIIYGGNV